MIYDNSTDKNYTVKKGAFGLSDVAATAVNFLGYRAPDIWDESIIDVK